VFERFTERARQVVVLAQDEARTLGHGYIGTEHLLLGLIREQDGVAARALGALGVTEDDARAQVAAMVVAGDDAATGQIPFTRRAKEVLELALREALALGHNYIGTEHILLGLLRENQGIGAQVLRDLGADPERVRSEILPLLAAASRTPSAHPARATRFAEGSPQLIVACPQCATPIETVTTDAPNSTLEVTAEGARTCPGCGKEWRIAYAVVWVEAEHDP
jgi:ATP-dependent Clp protease ATP-binding subunit ClpC